MYELLVGIDPFGDDDPMFTYDNILKCKLKFPSSVPKKAKSLIKHLVQKNISKRYGNLKKGVKDIKKHKWFKKFN